jgi:site-specific recombinase XerD
MRSHAATNRKLAQRYSQWMKALHYAKSTQQTNMRAVGSYLKFTGDRSIATATHEDVRGYIARISEDGASLGCVYRNLHVLRVFYDFLNMGGLVHYVMPRFVFVRHPQVNTPHALSESQVRRLIAATRTLRERALVEFLYGTGCRLREAARLKIEDIDFEDRSSR